MGVCGGKDNITLPPDNGEKTDETRVADSITRNKLAARYGRGKRRAAVEGYNNIDQLVRDYVKHTVKKSPEVRALIKSSLASHFLFSTLGDNTVKDVIDVMTQETFKAGAVVIRQGDNKGDKFYVIESGVYSIDVNGKLVAEYDGKTRPSQNFGELSLLYNQPRAATIIAKTDGVLWCLDRLAFMKYMVTNSSARRDHIQTILVDLLKKNDFFGQLSSRALAGLSESFLLKEFKTGETIIQEGTQGSVFYLLSHGMVEVRKEGKGKIMTLKSGEYFGERALINNEPRGASCVAASSCLCYALGKSDFQTIIASKHLKAQMEKTHEMRVAAETKCKSKELVPRMICGLKDFKDVRVIGMGAFGMVRLVKHTATGKPFAVKKGATKDMQLERKVLEMLDQRNCAYMAASFDVKQKTYLVLEFLQGGDLITQICRSGTFKLSKARYYTGCVILAFEEMHRQDIAYRDLKLENLVLAKDGTLKLVDFGLAKIVTSRTYTVCGTPEYMAPEIIRAKGHGIPVDYWALGILIFEMLNGDTPFMDPTQDHIKIYKKILIYCKKRFTDPRKKALHYPAHISKATQDLISGFLNPRDPLRFGCTKNGLHDVFKHAFFDNFDWDELRAGKTKPPYVPDCCEDPFSTANFEEFVDQEKSGCTIS